MAYSFKMDSEELESATTDNTNFTPLPKGSYEAELIDIKIVPFSKKEAYADVDALSLTWKLTEDNPTGANRRVFDRVALIPKWRNANKTPNFTLNQLAVALGLVDDEGNFEIPEDLDELLDESPVVGIALKVRDAVLDSEGKVQYDASNEVDRYLTTEQLAARRKSATTPKVEKSDNPAEKKNSLFI